LGATIKDNAENHTHTHAENCTLMN
jgi:hypothetical protein